MVTWYPTADAAPFHDAKPFHDMAAIVDMAAIGDMVLFVIMYETHIFHPGQYICMLHNIYKS